MLFRYDWYFGGLTKIISDHPELVLNSLSWISLRVFHVWSSVLQSDYVTNIIVFLTFFLFCFWVLQIGILSYSYVDTRYVCRLITFTYLSLVYLVAHRTFATFHF